MFAFTDFWSFSYLMRYGNWTVEFFVTLILIKNVSHFAINHLGIFNYKNHIKNLNTYVRNKETKSLLFFAFALDIFFLIHSVR